MPTPIIVRRVRSFRPLRFTARHRQVARLLALGLRQKQVAEITGYSVSHVSRVAAMPEARWEMIAQFSAIANTLYRDLVRRAAASNERAIR